MIHYLLLLLHILPLVSPLSCFSCYSFTSNSTSFTDYLPPLLLTMSRDSCSHGNTVTCPPASTCLFTSLQLVYGDDRAEVTTMGCAGVREMLTCSALESGFNHPLFDLDSCQVKRCQFDRCNDGGVLMLSGVRGLEGNMLVVVTAVLVNLISILYN